MKFQSTRGGDVGLSFQDVVMSGYAPDDGLYMPVEIPQLSEQMLESWASLSYKDIVKEIAKLYIEDEIPAEKVCELIDAGYESFENSTNPIVVKSLSDDVTVLEMFHGKSLAFKDLSMCCAAQFIRYFLEQSNTYATLLIATSGDTGSAALQALSAIDHVDTVVLLPKGRISRVQEMQMTSVVSDNCHVIRVEGTSDDTDVPVRKVSSDAELVKKYNVGCLNSINWSRMMVHVAHHFYAYYQGKRVNADKETLVFIPTGGSGNATGACIAREMGLPLQIVCAVTNDALYRAVYNQDYSITDPVVSLASAMDIQVIANFGRILFMFTGMDTALVKQLQDDYGEGKKVLLPDVVIDKLKVFMEVMMVTDEEILAAMKRCQKENDGYIVCPHTAAALAAVYRCDKINKYNPVVYGVASPAKFPDALKKAGIEWNGRNLQEELETKEVRYTDWEASDDWVEKLIGLFQTIAERHQQ